MPGEEVQVGTGGERRRSGTGPRHAAPRRSILERLQMPAGRAIALAAMPSAVLMGMGFTPRLAQADEIPENGFAPGKCVTVPDASLEEDAEDDQAQKKDRDTREHESKDTSERAGERAAAEDVRRDADEPSGTPSAGKRSGASQGHDHDTSVPRLTPAPEGDRANGKDRPVADKPRPKRDEGGRSDDILNASKDTVTPGRGDRGSDAAGATEDKTAQRADGTKNEQASPPASSTPEPGDQHHAAGTAKDRPARTGDKVAAREAGEAKDVRGDEDANSKGAKGNKDLGDPRTAEDTEGIPATSKEAGTKRSPSVEEAPAQDKTDGTPGAEGKEPFPCPEERRVAGKNEQTPNVLPDKPWVLQSSRLALHGLDYKGVVNVRTANGSTKQALKFTVSGVDIRDLHQLVDGPDGLTYHVQAGRGTTSKIRNGTVTMYTERLRGKILGLIPITFDPEHPPPLNLPEIFFTDVTVKQAGQFGGELTIPGMRVFTTRG